MDVEILDLLSKKLGFRYFVSPALGWDFYGPNGDRRGVVGQVVARFSTIFFPGSHFHICAPFVFQVARGNWDAGIGHVGLVWDRCKVQLSARSNLHP